MAVNQEFVGRTYPPDTVFEVGREHIREFAEAVSAADGATTVHPAHRDPAAARALGYADVIAPPTFAVVIAQRSDGRLVFDPAVGIDFSRVVHGEQRFVHHRPIVAGDRLVATLHVDSVRSAGGHSMVVTRSEITTEAGDAVCTATSMLIVRAEESR